VPRFVKLPPCLRFSNQKPAWISFLSHAYSILISQWSVPASVFVWTSCLYVIVGRFLIATPCEKQKLLNDNFHEGKWSYKDLNWNKLRSLAILKRV
jgi:hypothetical protein